MSLNSRHTDLLRKKVLNIARNIKINTLDTKIATIGNRYLPRETMSIVWDHLPKFINKNIQCR